jgi:hypothetical protein
VGGSEVRMGTWEGGSLAGRRDLSIVLFCFLSCDRLGERERELKLRDRKRELRGANDQILSFLVACLVGFLASWPRAAEDYHRVNRDWTGALSVG